MPARRATGATVRLGLRIASPIYAAAIGSICARICLRVAHSTARIRYRAVDWFPEPSPFVGRRARIAATSRKVAFRILWLSTRLLRRRVTRPAPSLVGSLPLPLHRTAAAVARIEARAAVSTTNSKSLPSHLIHATLLLFERHPGLRTASAAGEIYVSVLRKSPCANLPVSQTQAGPIRRYRQHSVHQTGIANGCSAHTDKLARMPPEIGRTHRRNAIVDPSVPVYVSDVRVVYDCRVIAETPISPKAAIDTPAPPWAEALVRRERYPPHVAESEPNSGVESATAAKSEERHQRRAPIMV